MLKPIIPNRFYTMAYKNAVVAYFENDKVIPLDKYFCFYSRKSWDFNTRVRRICKSCGYTNVRIALLINNL